MIGGGGGWGGAVNDGRGLKEKRISLYKWYIIIYNLYHNLYGIFNIQINS